MRGKNRGKARKTLTEQNNDSSFRSSLSATTSSISSGSQSIRTLLDSRFDGIGFADDVDPGLVADVLSFSDKFSWAMFTLNECIAPSETREAAQAWFLPMLFDAAYLNAICFTLQSYLDEHLKRRRTIEAERRGRICYGKTVRILQERLSSENDSIRLSDSTIMTVLALSGHAYTIGDYRSSDHHINGLLKLVRMRGLKSLLVNTKLAIEVVRSDLNAAIDAGSLPMLLSTNFNDPSDTNNLHRVISGVLDAPPLPIMMLQGCRSDLISKLSPRLADVWSTMFTFCDSANSALAQQKASINEKSFLNHMISVMYRLLDQNPEAGTVDEAFRLGLLAFSSPVFLHWNRDEPLSERVVIAYREILQRLDTIQSIISPQASTWLMVVGAVSMSQESESMAWMIPWLRESMRLSSISTPSELLSLMRSLLWIGRVHDAAFAHVSSLLFLHNVDAE